MQLGNGLLLQGVYVRHHGLARCGRKWLPNKDMHEMKKCTIVRECDGQISGPE